MTYINSREYWADSPYWSDQRYEAEMLALRAFCSNADCTNELQKKDDPFCKPCEEVIQTALDANRASIVRLARTQLDR